MLTLVPALTVAMTRTASASDDRAREQYLLHCSGCHRADGSGVAGATPSLHALAPLLGSDRGRAYLIRVPGVAQAPIDDAALARLLDWVLENFSGVAPEPRFSADEVARWRADPLRDPGAERRALIAGPNAGTQEAETRPEIPSSGERR